MSIGVTTASRKLVSLAALLLAPIAFDALAQNSPTASPLATAKPRDVRISFLPPPLEGTISLGIFDASGKLVRTLNRESDIEEFEAASDSLVTHWDGNDDRDQPLPAGKYHARGYMVGDLDIEGVGFYFNDWVSDERSERVSKICAIAAEADGVVVSARIEPDAGETLICDAKGAIVASREDAAVARCSDDPSAGAPDEPAAVATGKDHTRWAIERADGDPNGSEVKQYSASNELLRRMSIPRGNPQPRRIAAARDADRIYLLEENANEQRLRGLSLVTTTPGAEHADSDWKVDFEKRITAHKNFRVADGRPVITGGDEPATTARITLQPNPLRKNAKETAELAVGSDFEGSFLQTADGLRLQTISETARLSRAVLSPHDAKSIDVFQDDGVVVEQFRVGDLDQMMAFDCGEIELK